ncbi:hypothetical protein SO694_00002525 [Aureococcus anophagefferens]|uniref:Uncharacterized protein n=1 Tax=Aureococcus anophagefferens TaxID=44056 RepID=A0ABR1GD60_AURAN
MTVPNKRRLSHSLPELKLMDKVQQFLQDNPPVPAAAPADEHPGNRRRKIDLSRTEYRAPLIRQPEPPRRRPRRPRRRRERGARDGAERRAVGARVARGPGGQRGSKNYDLDATSSAGGPAPS